MKRASICLTAALWTACAAPPGEPTPPGVVDPTPFDPGSPTPGSTATPDGPSITEAPTVPHPSPPELLPTPAPTPMGTPDPTPDPGSSPTPDPGSSPTPGNDCEPVPAGSLTLEAASETFVRDLYPLMTRESGGCADCHASSSGRLMRLGADGPDSFNRLYHGEFLGRGPNTILDRVTRTDAAAMPMGGPAWSADEQARLSCFVDYLEQVEAVTTPPPDPCEMPRDPGHKTIHRLNRAEYNNTVRDLLGDTTRPADAFPADDRGYGFDNIADVLAVAPLLVEKWDLAAEQIVNRALGEIPPSIDYFFEAEEIGAEIGSVTETGWKLNSPGAIVLTFDFPHGGDWRIRAASYGEQAGPDPARMSVSVDGIEVTVFDVPAEEDAPQIDEVITWIDEGEHEISLAFINDYFSPRAPAGEKDRNLVIDWFQLEGPIDAVPISTPVRDAIVTCTPAAGQEAACARQILEGFGKRAWRRPLTGEELERLVGLVNLVLEEGDRFETGIRLALQAVLLSPHFVYRVEVDPDPASADPHALDDYELASRLSYFLWSSMPDAELLSLADRGTLSQPEVLAAQVARMLGDPKAAALVDNFAGQWLYSRGVYDVQPDPELFPDFDETLRHAMAMETRLYFQAFLEENLSLLDMLDANFTFLNDRLAAHYGMPPVGSEDLVRVALPEGQGGLLTHASINTVTSYPDRTSPVLRGKWVLSQLMCQPPEPPPAGVEGLEEPEVPTGSQRELMEAHRSNPECAACHAVMDPIGFGLENYNAVGKWRTIDDYGYPVDASGVLPPDRAFNGPFELSRLLKEDPAFPRCASMQMLVYALGRGLNEADDCAVKDLSEDFAGTGYQMTELIQLITESEPFRMRRGEPEGEAP